MAASDAPGVMTGKLLIESDRVEGTTVYDRAGNHISSIKRLMIDKLSGKGAYAVMSFGGFLGMNEKFHPVPWSVLDYDETEDSYVVPFTKEQLQAAPADSIEKLTRADGAATYATRANDYYNLSH